jgi:S1-C subfamily serine protease
MALFASVVLQLGSVESLPVVSSSAVAGSLTSDENAVIRLFKATSQSVVYITNLAFRRDAFTMNTLEIPQGAGSGIVWDSETIVTNLHVVRGSSDLMVALGEGQESEAKIVGVDQDNDIAVLKLANPIPNLRPIKVGSSTNLSVGQSTYAIGNPFGLDHTLTTGVISGLGREITSSASGRPISQVIQTDCSINPGNSGGPLLNSSGEMIGINTAIFSTTGMNAGVGFAIPSDTVKNSVQQILENGKVSRPLIGITFAPDAAVDQLGISGILVLSAKPGSPAEAAGITGTQRDDYGRLVLGDIIIGVNSIPVNNSSDLFRVLNACKVGDMLDLEMLRGDAKVHVEVQLGSSD